MIQPSTWTRTHSPERPITRAGDAGLQRRIDVPPSGARASAGLPGSTSTPSAGPAGAAGTGLCALPARRSASALGRGLLAAAPGRPAWPGACRAVTAARGTQPVAADPGPLALLSRPARAGCPRAPGRAPGRSGAAGGSRPRPWSRPGRTRPAGSGRWTAVKIHPSTVGLAPARPWPRRPRPAPGRQGHERGAVGIRVQIGGVAELPLVLGRDAVRRASAGDAAHRLVADAGRD